MAEVTARIKAKGKNYEVKVDLDIALQIQSGSSTDIVSALKVDAIYNELSKGTVASQSDLKDAFGTSDTYEVALHIIKKGEVQKTQAFRDDERDMKVKQVVSLIVKNAVDQNGNPYTEDRLKRAIDEVHYSFTAEPAEKQMTALVHALKTVIPIRVETKRIRLTIPAQYTGQIYGIVSEHKDKEEWLDNGDLSVIVNVPAGLVIDFYEKLNSVTHGAVQSEELASEE
tara:strand:- start:3044 stop:3724 length:681 start_codon:yes stop_codon:yes gene_type:complete